MGLSIRQLQQMPGNVETGQGRAGAEIPQPSPGAAFKSGAEARALRRAGGDVVHDVEGG
jgi:hypothetical protein